MSLLRRLLDSRPLGRRVRRRWEYTRPFPLPHYTAGTPKIAGSGPLDIFLPANPSTVGAAALEATAPVETVLAKMTQIEEIQALRTYYQSSREKFGGHWRYADLLSALWAAATLNPPATYLEVGVRTGRSAAVVGAAAPACDIYGFDLWPPDYAGTTIRGPDFVRGELKRVGHTGSVTLVAGDSSKTLPAFLREHPDLYFDLVTIDGAKAIAISGSDFANALPRLKVGGIVVCDDICLAPHLARLWDTVVKRDPRYVTWQFAEGTVGVAAAVRMSDDPVEPSLFDTE